MNYSIPIEAASHIDALPPLPEIALKILSTKINSDEGEASLFKLIERDPPTMAKIIGLSNSPLFGTSRKIFSLHDAALVLGTNRIKMVALSLAMMSSMTRSPAGLLNVHNLWLHSLAIAMAMDTLAHFMPRDLRPSDDEIYLAGLLHDIGYLILDFINPQLSDEFHARLANLPERPVEEVELEMLGTTHSELGGILARQWNLPESIVSVLEFHHQIFGGDNTILPPLVRMSILAENLFPTFKIDSTGEVNIKTGECQSLGIDPSKVDEIKIRIQSHVREVASFGN